MAHTIHVELIQLDHNVIYDTFARKLEELFRRSLDKDVHRAIQADTELRSVHLPRFTVVLVQNVLVVSPKCGRMASCSEGLTFRFRSWELGVTGVAV